MDSCQNCKELSANYFRLKKCYHIFCHKCLCEYIERVFTCQIKCPVCHVNIPDQIIRKCLSNSQIRLYEQLCVLSSNPKAKKCLTPKCPMMKVIENNNAIYHCEYCDQPNCLKCKKRHYPNQCGLNISEEHINNAAIEAIKKKKQEELKDLGEMSIIPNPEKFECCLCLSFVLPREGLITRNCHHCFCKGCFQEGMKNIKFIKDFKCLQCQQNLNPQDINEFVDLPKFCSINCKPVALKMFNCKYPNCIGMWDRNNCKGVFQCKVCKHINCLECEAIHDNQSCEKYRNSKEYSALVRGKSLLKNVVNEKVNCLCGALIIIARGGCGAIYCNECGRSVCQFTGKLAGNIGPDSCGCTSIKPCHKNCLYGCFPEK